MVLTDKQLRDFADYLKPDKKESPTIQINATVHSIDSSGDKPVYYVNFDGAEGMEPCPVSSTIAEGEQTLQPDDRVIVLVKDREGTIVGNIDKPMASSTYDDTELRTLIADAKKYATNYMKFTPGDYHPVSNPNAGLVLSQNAEATNLGRNLQLMSGGIAIRNNTTDLALFDEDDIYLGLDSDQAVIHFCQDKGEIYYDDYNDALVIHSNNLSNGAIMTGTYEYESENPYYGTITKERQIAMFNDGIKLFAHCSRSLGGQKEAYVNIGANEYGIEYGGYIEAYAAYLNLNIYEGGITYNDHTSYIGTIISVTGGTEYTSNLSSGSETWKTIASITIPAGTWVVNYRVRYQNDSSGNHVIRTYFTTSSDSTAFSDSQFGAASAYLYSNNTVVISVDSDTTYYLRGYATVAGTWYRSASSYMRIAALRIL